MNKIPMYKWAIMYCVELDYIYLLKIVGYNLYSTRVFVKVDEEGTHSDIPLYANTADILDESKNLYLGLLEG